MLLVQNNNWKLGTSNKGNFCGIESQLLWIESHHSKALQHKLKPILPSTTFSACKNDTYIGECWIMLSFSANIFNNTVANQISHTMSRKNALGHPTHQNLIFKTSYKDGMDKIIWTSMEHLLICLSPFLEPKIINQPDSFSHLYIM